MIAGRVPRSGWLAAGAVALSGASHLAGLTAWEGPPETLIEGGGGGAVAVQGTAFEDLVAGGAMPVAAERAPETTPEAARPFEAAERADVPEPEVAARTAPEAALPEVPPIETARVAPVTTAQTPEVEAAAAPAARPAEAPDAQTAARADNQATLPAQTVEAAPPLPAAGVPMRTVLPAEIAGAPAPADVPPVEARPPVAAVAAPPPVAPRPEALPPVAALSAPASDAASAAPLAPLAPVAPAAPVASAEVVPEDDRATTPRLSARPPRRPASIPQRAAELAAARAAEAARQTLSAPQTPPAQGNATVTARRGATAGQVDGQAATSGTGRRRQAGNAEISNYRGQVQSCVARAAARAGGGRSARVRVSFAVGGNGRIGPVSASGDPRLARAVQRAVAGARCPAPPAGAPRSYAVTVTVR